MTEKSGKTSRTVQQGDTVEITCIPEGLLRGLPKEDQQAIRECVGKSFVVGGF